MDRILITGIETIPNTNLDLSSFTISCIVSIYETRLVGEYFPLTHSFIPSPDKLLRARNFVAKILVH